MWWIFGDLKLRMRVPMGQPQFVHVQVRRGPSPTSRCLVHRHMFGELPTNTRLDIVANVTMSNTDTSKARQYMFVVALYLCTCSFIVCISQHSSSGPIRVRVRNPTFRFPPLYSPMYVRQKLLQKTRLPANRMQDSRAQA